ncbi:MAG: helix-turn-helix domain-containing protein [Bacteroidota bacterium]
MQPLTVGSKIKKIREIKGIKQETIARTLKMTPNGYGKIERDESKITIDRLEEIAEALQVSIADILGFDANAVTISNPHSNFHNSVLNTAREVHNHNGLSEKERQLYEDKIKLLEEMVQMKDELLSVLKSSRK